MTSGPWLDLPANLFAAPADDGAERRGRERRPYGKPQWIAPCLDGKLPDPQMFREVRCYDISQGGISFYTHQPPLDEFLVVALAAGPQTIYVKARVANCVRVSNRAGSTFRVGCEFISRVELTADQ